MALAVWMDRVRCVYPRAQPTQIVGPDYVLVVEATADVFQKALEFCQVLMRALGHARGEEACRREQMHASAANGDV